MAHDVTVVHTPGQPLPWQAVCADGDMTSDPTDDRCEAIDTANWHASQHAGTVTCPDTPP